MGFLVDFVQLPRELTNGAVELILDRVLGFPVHHLGDESPS